MSEDRKTLSPFSARITIRNSGLRPRIIWVEPIPEDFTLLPGEELTVLARDQEDVPGFMLLEYDGPTQSATQVYLEQSVDTPYDDYDVIQNGVRLETGHNRQAAIDAGLDM